MKIVILNGSPHLQGSTALLIESFTKGAEEKGHEVQRFNIAQMNIHPCTGCLHCNYGGPCIFKDDNKKIRDSILKADMLVFATPLYYFGMTSMLKAVIDRFCSYNYELHAKRMKSALLSVAWNNDEWTFDSLKSHYLTLVKYCHFQDMGSILGKGCGSKEMTAGSHYINDAYTLGKEL